MEFITENLWGVYLSLGLLFGLAEFWLPGLFGLPVAMGAIATIPFSFFLPLPVTVALWGGLSGASYWVLKRFSKRTKNSLKTGVDGLIGQMGTVTQTIKPRQNEGKVKRYGDEWYVFGANEEIEEGTQVKLLEFQGNRVRVEPIYDDDERYEIEWNKRLNDS